MDYAHRRHKSVSAMLPAGGDAPARMQAAATVTAAWRGLEGELLAELEAEGFGRQQISLRQIAYIRYYGQLEDVEVESPVSRLESAGEVDELLSRFEEVFTKMFTLAARPAAPTYHVTEVSVIAQVDTVKPKLVRHPLQDRAPRAEASKGTRPVFQRGRWQTAQIYEMGELRPGNQIDGLAVIEAPNTTLFVPNDWHVRIDEYDIYWLTRSPST
jgi:N-methylhydantoinase A/oxoprolinase/acetone carboxylase beta subunit